VKAVAVVNDDIDNDVYVVGIATVNVPVEKPKLPPVAPVILYVEMVACLVFKVVVSSVPLYVKAVAVDNDDIERDEYEVGVTKL
jgi:hypothetical protein